MVSGAWVVAVIMVVVKQERAIHVAEQKLHSKLCPTQLHVQRWWTKVADSDKLLDSAQSLGTPPMFRSDGREDLLSLYTYYCMKDLL